MAETEKTVRIGCAGLPPRMSNTKYFAQLSFLQSDAMTGTAPPKTKVFRKWREANPDAAFALVAPVISIPAADAGMERTRLATAALCAEVVLFKTPASLSPSADGREALRSFFTEVATSEALNGATRVWQPAGLWEPHVAVALAASMDVLLVVDPLASDPLKENDAVLQAALERGHVYINLTGMGLPRARFDEFALGQLAEFVDQAQHAWVAFGNPAKFKDALAFRKALA